MIILVSPENLHVLEEMLKNFLANKTPFAPEQLVLQPVLPSPWNSNDIKLPEEPLDLSMRSDVPSHEDFEYGSGSEQMMSLPDLSLDEQLTDHSMEFEGKC